MDQEILKAFNVILEFLTTSQPVPTSWHPDAVVWCGNSQLVTGQQARTLAKKYQVPLILSGGTGHATQYLLNQLPVKNKRTTEAASMASWLQDNDAVPPKLILESSSTNSGENADYSLAICQRSNWRQILLIQDPILQLRSLLTFQHQAPLLSFYSWSKQLKMQQWQPLVFDDSRYHWPNTYFAGVILGELDRLANTTTGYGPKGKNFINAVKLPDSVLTAQSLLISKKLITNR